MSGEDKLPIDVEGGKVFCQALVVEQGVGCLDDNLAVLVLERLLGSGSVPFAAPYREFFRRNSPAREVQF